MAFRDIRIVHEDEISFEDIIIDVGGMTKLSLVYIYLPDLYADVIIINID